MNKYIDLDLASKALMLNEIGTNLKVAIKLSWAGNSNSGISFGYQQIDTKHNSKGFELLNKFGCKKEDIDLIKKFNNNPTNSSWNNFKNSISYKNINLKLEENDKELKNIFSNSIKSYFDHLKKIGIFNLNFKDNNCIIHLMDYHNQFDLSNNGKMHNWLKQQKNISSELIKKFKIEQTKWGTTTNGKNDIERRFKNIESIDGYIVTTEKNLYNW